MGGGEYEPRRSAPSEMWLGRSSVGVERRCACMWMVGECGVSRGVCSSHSMRMGRGVWLRRCWLYSSPAGSLMMSGGTKKPFLERGEELVGGGDGEDVAVGGVVTRIGSAGIAMSCAFVCMW